MAKTITIELTLVLDDDTSESMLKDAVDYADEALEYHLQNYMLEPAAWYVPNGKKKDVRDVISSRLA